MLILLLLLLAFAMVLTVPQHHGSTSSQGTQRTLFLVLACGVILSTAVSWPLGLVLLVLVVNVLRSAQPLLTLPRVYPLLGLLGAGLVLKSQPEFVWWSLVSIVAMGIWLGVWTCVTLAYRCKPYATGIGPFRMSEPPGEFRVVCGQENPNNLQALSAVCSTAVMALAWLSSPWVFLCLPLIALPVLAVQWRQRGEQAATLGPWVWLCTALLALPIWVSPWMLFTWLPVVAGCAWAMPRALRSATWWDSGRVRAWWLMLVAGWWTGGPMVWLLGHGWGSWTAYFEQLCIMAKQAKERAVRKGLVDTTVMLSTAHNEYVQLLFEHGLLGFAALLTALGVTGYRLAHGSLEQQAVLLVGLSVCAVATVLHPWTWYHQTLTQTKQGYRFWSMGSPGLVYASWLIAVCAEIDNSKLGV